MSRIIPVYQNIMEDSSDDIQPSWSILKYSQNQPLLKWSETNRDGILNSGWSLFKTRKTNICFRNEMETRNRMWFVIEFPYKKNILNLKDLVAIGFFFTFNKDKGTIDLCFRLKQFLEKESCVVYKNCKYFGIEKESIYSHSEDIAFDNSYFVVSNDWQEKSLITGVNFLKRFTDFHYITEHINNIIQKKLVESNRIPEFSQAFPLLLCKGGHQVIMNDTSAHNLVEMASAKVIGNDDDVSNTESHEEEFDTNV